MKSFVIEENSANQRLDKFITKNLPNLPQSLLYKYIRTKRIKVNGKRAEISTRLSVGDVVDMYIKDEFFEKPDPHYDFLHAPKDIDIIFEDENLLILNKRQGLLSHPDDTEYVDTLISRVKRYLYEKGEYDPDAEQAFTPALINRIDRNTGRRPLLGPGVALHLFKELHDELCEPAVVPPRADGVRQRAQVVVRVNLRVGGFEHLFEGCGLQRGRLVFVRNLKIRAQRRGGAVLAQQVAAEGMDRADLRAGAESRLPPQLWAQDEGVRPSNSDLSFPLLG